VPLHFDIYSPELYPLNSDKKGKVLPFVGLGPCGSEAVASTLETKNIRLDT
jgi:hypothetical protein